MATEYGLTLTGFVPKTFSVLDDGVKSDIRSSLGASTPTHSASVAGQLASIVAILWAELWEQLQQISASQDPDMAVGDALVALSALTGTLRRPATRSSVTLTLTGANATVVGEDSRVKTLSTAKEFITVSDATITTLVAWVAATAYVVDDRRTNAGRAYVCIAAGTSAAAGGPTTTAASIVDGVGSLRWRYMGEGVGAADVEAVAAETGPTTAVSGDITVKVTAVGGWQSVINLLDADLGSNVETDAELRVRRQLELAASGASTVDAIRSAMLDIAGVTHVGVFPNDTDITDIWGVPPHSVEIVVRGGDDQDIFDAVLANVAAGIGTYGDEVGAAVDSQGISHVVKFSRLDTFDIWMSADIYYNPETFPTDGEAQIKSAMAEFGDEHEPGDDFIARRIAAKAFDIAGVNDVVDPRVDTADPPLSGRVVMGTRHIGLMDTSRIALTLIADP